MGVTLERVQFKFASIIGELCSEPDILSQFAVWVDLRLAEYKLKGSISLDCSGESPDPVWLKGIKSAILEKALSLRTAPGGDIGRTGPVRSPKPHTASRATNSARDSRGPSTPSVEQRLSPVVIKEEPTDVFPVSIHRSKTDSRKRPITDTESGDRDLLNSTSSPNKQSRLEANPENESLMSIIGMDSAEDETPEIAEVSQENIAREIDYLISQNAAEKAGQDTTQMLGDSSYSSPYPSTSSQGANNNGYKNIIKRSIPTQGVIVNSPHGFLPQRQNQLSERLLHVDRRTRSRINTFESWLQDEPRKDFRAMEQIPPEELDALLSEFYSTVKTLTGEEYSENSFSSLKNCLVRFLRTQCYPHSPTSSPLFAGSRATWKRKLEERRQEARKLAALSLIRNSHLEFKDQLNITPSSPTAESNHNVYTIETVPETAAEFQTVDKELDTNPTSVPPAPPTRRKRKRAPPKRHFQIEMINDEPDELPESPAPESEESVKTPQSTSEFPTLDSELSTTILSQKEIKQEPLSDTDIPD